MKNNYYKILQCSVYYKRTFILFTFFITYIYSFDISADIRKKPFPSRKKPTTSLYLGGNYSSDYNSKDYNINCGARYKNKKFMHEFKFYNKVTEGHTTTKAMRKTKELYEVELSNKMMISDSKNYFNIYNLFEQDKYKNFNSSDKLIYDNQGYYNRFTSVAGLGRVFSLNFESDINIGHSHSEGEGSSIVVNPVLYLRKKITKTFKVNSRISRFQKEKTKDDYFSISFTKKITKKLAISLYQKYSRTEYIYRKKTSKVNIREVRKRSTRSLSLNLKYYL